MTTDRSLQIVFILLIALLAWTSPALAAPDEDELRRMREAGVSFYVPFEGTPRAAIARGQAEPWLAKTLEFVEGRRGQAVRVTARLDEHSNSMLAYEAAGNINRRRGTIAFWVKTPWDGRNRDVLTGSTFSGPYLLGISSVDGNNNFFYFWRRKTFFDVNFHGEYIHGDQMRLQRRWDRELFGNFSGTLVDLWEKDVWQHVAITWDDRRGWALYFNGDRVDGFEGEIEWDLNTPDSIALGTRPLRNRDVQPVSSDYAFDEFLIFNRPLEGDEVQSVMAGAYQDLRPVEPDDEDFDEAARRRAVKLEDAPGRPSTSASKGMARMAIRQVPVADVKMPFYGGFKLVDGDFGSSVRFRDGGLNFDTPAEFHFTRPSRADLAVVDASEPKASHVPEPEDEGDQRALTRGRTYIEVEPRDRDSFDVFFKGGSSVQQVSFFEVGSVRSEETGQRHEIHGLAPPDQHGDARRALLREIEYPWDQLVLSAGGDNEGPDTVSREKLAHTFVLLEPDAADRFIDTLRLHLPLQAGAPFRLALRIVDPQIPEHVNFHATLKVDDPPPHEWTTLDWSVSPAGLVLPADRPLLLVLTADAPLTLDLGSDSYLEIVDGDEGRIGREFADTQLRNLWPQMLRRVRQNRFLRPGETRDTSRLYQGLRRALKYDPGNAMASTWLHWARLEPWPEYDFSEIEQPPGPRWARYMREAVESKQDVIHWWLDHRSNEDGYLAGPGNKWNDITKLYNKFLALGALVSDERLVDSVERYLDLHWNSGRMVDGYAYNLTDMTHSCEEASYIQPAMHVLRPGVARHVYRDLRTTANLETWLGVNDDGHTHFRSNYFNAQTMETEGVFGRDKADGDSATVPAKYLHWYSGHARSGEWILELADAWLAATFREEADKKAGAIPAEVDFQTGRAHPGSGGRRAGERFLTAYQFSREAKYLRPLDTLVEQGADVYAGSSPFRHHARSLLGQINLTDATSLPDNLRESAEEALAAIADDAFFQRGIENREAQAMLLWTIDGKESQLIEMLRFVARNNRRAFPIYTHTEAAVDRVYPWGRVVLPVAMLGGRLFDGRAANPVPMAAFAWEDTDTDVVSLVTDRQRDGLTMLVHNFKDRPVEAGIRVLDLPEGRYRLEKVAFDDQAGEPRGQPQSEERELRRFSPTPLKLPARQTVKVELALREKRPDRMRPDLAVTLAQPVGEDGQVVARVHNLGPRAVEQTRVRLELDDEIVDAAQVRDLPALSGFEPSFVDVTLEVPARANLDDAVLRVDPDSAVDEINDANNAYPLHQGVPAPVETQRPPYSGEGRIKTVRW